MNKYADLQPNEIVWQIFVGPNGIPHVFKMSVISSDENSLVVVPLGEVGEFSHQIVTYDEKSGIPRTYRSNEINKMFGEYLYNIEGWQRSGMFATTPKELEAEIAKFGSILELWKQTRRRAAAVRPKGADGADEESEPAEAPK